MFANRTYTQFIKTKRIIFNVIKGKTGTKEGSRKFCTAPRKSGSLWGKYMNLLERKPLATKVVTSGVLAFGSDVICQKIDSAYINKGKEIDL